MSVMDKFETRSGCNLHSHEPCKKRHSEVECCYFDFRLAKARVNCHRQNKIRNW